MRRQPTDVTQLLDEVIAKQRAGGRTIVLDVARSPALIVEIDPVALRRILDNLLNNALRYTRQPGTVTAGRLPSEPISRGAPEVLIFRVSDTGRGFPLAFLPHAFDRFGRADQGRTRSAASAGNGLGLAIVKAHGGSATGIQRREWGAVVEVRIPFAAEASGA